MKVPTLTFVIAAAITALPSTAHAGVKEGGGGSAVFIKGERGGAWELADLFVAHALPGSPMEVSPEMRQYLQAIRAILRDYGVDSDEFWNDQVLGRRVEFRYADPLPCQDDPLPVADPALAQHSYGCTQRGVTYLSRAMLDRFTFSNKALAILHERLHAFQPSARHEAIAGVIAGLRFMIDMSLHQASGLRRALFPEEQRTLATLLDSARTLGFTMSPVEVWPNGGGALFRHRKARGRIDEDTFIGIGSVVQLLGFGSIARSQLVETRILEFKSGEILDAVIERSILRGIGRHKWLRVERSRIRDSEVEASGFLEVDASGAKFVRCGLESTRFMGKLCVDSMIWVFDVRDILPTRFIPTYERPRAIVEEGAVIRRSYFQVHRVDSSVPEFTVAQETGIDRIFGITGKIGTNMRFESPGRMLWLNNAIFMDDCVAPRSAPTVVARSREDLRGPMIAKPGICEGDPETWIGARSVISNEHME